MADPENVAGPGWEMFRPRLEPTSGHTPSAQHLVPEARWFWYSVESVRDWKCCGIDAFDFSEESILRACSQSEAPTNVADFINELRVTATSIRAMDLTRTDP